MSPEHQDVRGMLIHRYGRSPRPLAQTAVPAVPGRWPGLGKCMGLWPERDPDGRTQPGWPNATWMGTARRPEHSPEWSCASIGPKGQPLT